MGVIHPSLAFVGVYIFTTFCFLCHNLCSRCATKPIKGSKDLVDSLVSKKIDSLDWRPGPGKVGHKNAKTPLLVTPPKRTQTQNWKLFSVETRSLAESVDGRGGRSNFSRLQLRSCTKIFKSGSGNFIDLRIRLLFRLRLQSSIQPWFTHVFT